MFNRRDIFRFGGLAALASGVGGRIRTAFAAPMELTANMYRSIGVRPLINARGTFTIVTGSQSLPEVKRAMELASRGFVHMDELMEAVSKRLAEITQAPWGIVTNGCCAGITHFTAASIAGGNPERMQQLPNLTGMKNEVVIPAYSRNQYDHAVRMLGTKLVVVREAAELERAFNERTAMVYILAGNGDKGPLGTKAISDVAKKYNVPVLVDAAAEILTIPNVHLAAGATVVAYSGGKCMRGPQAAGLLLGDKALLQAAWTNSAPHHAFGRSLKVGKEEIMGMLAAVEMWVKRDHKAEWAAWEKQLEHIATSVKRVDGVTSRVNQPSADLSNRTPTLNVSWDAAKLGISGTEVAKILLDTEPRIVLSGGGPSSVSVTPYQMMAGDEKVVADRLYAVLSKPPKTAAPPAPVGETASIAGQWDVKLDFSYGSASHSVLLEQDGTRLMGTHRGEFASGDLNGTVAAKTVRFFELAAYRGVADFVPIQRNSRGRTSGTVGLGEYGEAKFTAEKHQYSGGRGRRG